MNLDEALQAVREEVERAKTLFPWWAVDDAVHAAAIVAEEAGELLQAALRFTYESGNTADVHREALHTAAMAVRFLLANHERRPSEEAERHCQSYRTRRPILPLM